MEFIEDKWIEAICTVKFDLEEGQVIEFVYPKDVLSKETLKIIGNYSFPDSHVFQDEGILFYSFTSNEEEGLYCYSIFT